MYLPVWFASYSYYLGNGVSKNYFEAFRFFQLAANQGIAEAQYNLGVCFFNGNGTAKNPSSAEKWWRKAADKGYEDAQKALKSLGN